MSLPRLPRREPDAHKGDAGRVLVVAGSVGMAGAAFLAAKAAIRTGAGIVVLACPEAVYPVLAAKHTVVMVRPLPSTRTGGFALAALDPLLELARGQDAVALGPGIGRDPETEELARRFALRVGTKLVVDADALNAFSERPSELRGLRAVLTPHPGELSRLVGRGTKAINDDREAAIRAGLELIPEGVIVLKGKGSLVGKKGRLETNETGNPGMATAGSGDVLTGMIAALLGNGLDLFDAARLGVHLHGAAGDAAAAPFGGVPVPLIATDILEKIQQVVAAHLR